MKRHKLKEGIVTLFANACSSVVIKGLHDVRVQAVSLVLPVSPLVDIAPDNGSKFQNFGIRCRGSVAIYQFL